MDDDKTNLSRSSFFAPFCCFPRRYPSLEQFRLIFRFLTISVYDMRFLEEDEGGGVGGGGDCADCESYVESSTSQDKLPISEGQLYQILEGILFSSTKLEESLL